MGLIGGIIAYFVLRHDDPRKAKNCLYLGISSCSNWIWFELFFCAVVMLEQILDLM